jgi:hypothetical protein
VRLLGVRVVGVGISNVPPRRRGVILIFVFLVESR